MANFSYLAKLFAHSQSVIWLYEHYTKVTQLCIYGQ